MAKGLFAVAVLISFPLSSCAGVPQLDIQSPVTVAKIVDRIECEAWRARVNNPILATNHWTAVADLYLQVEDSAGLSPTLTYIEPLAQAGTRFTFGASGTLRRSRERVYNESIRLDMWKLNGKSCSKIDESYDLTGDLGIEETVNIALSSIDTNNAAVFSDKEAIGQTINFVLTREVSGFGPTWVLTPFIGPGALAGAERVDTHKLIISFAPGESSKVAMDGKKIARPTATAGERARQNNQNLLLQSLVRHRSL